VTAAVSRVEVVRVGDDHLPALTEFYRRVWDPQATVAKVERGRADAARANLATPGEPPPTWLVLQDGEAIAHVTTIPIRLWLNGRDHPAHWVKGLWVLPEHQRSAAGFLVLRAAAQAIDGVSLALVHEAAAIRLFGALGYSDLGALPNRLRVLRARQLLAAIDPASLGLGGLPAWVRQGFRLARPSAAVVGPLVDAAIALRSRVGSASLGGLHIAIEDRCDSDEVDALWGVARRGIRAAPARSGAYLTRRYGGADEYVFVHVRAGRTLVGLGVVKRPRDIGDPRLRGIRVATLSDLVFDPASARTGLAILRGAERAARGLGAAALLCGASATAVPPLLSRRAYLNLPANLHVLARSKDLEEPLPRALSEWWTTRGDSEGDGTF